MIDASHVPVLTSRRLVLRRHVEADLDAATAMWSDPEIVRYIGGTPFTRAEVWGRMLRYIGHWSLRPFGYWAITDRATGQFLGEVGLANWQRDGFGTYLDAPECGWVMARAAQRQGFALEALRTVLAWSDENLAARSVCIIEVENLASIRLAERVGYVQFQAQYDEMDATLLFERTVAAGGVI